MTLIGLCVAVAILILVLWIVKTYMPQPWQVPTLVVVVIIAVIFLLGQVFPGIWSVRVR